MKFICDKKLLNEAVSNVSLAVSPKSTLVALEGILFDCKNSKLTLTGYNLELGIVKTIDVSSKEDGAVILNARIISDILRKLPDEQVTITTDEKLLTVIKSGEAEFTILGITPSEYPDMPSLKDERTLGIDGGVLKSMISKTLFAVAQTEQTPVHTGSLFDIENGVLNVVSIDGYRLALRKEAVKTTENFKFVVPGKTLSEVLKLIPDNEDGDKNDEKGDNEVKINVSLRHIIFETNGYYIISRLLEGSFHDYKSAIPKESKSEALVNVRDFINCIDRASVIITDRIKSPVVSVFEDDSIKIKCTTTVGKISDEINIKYNGEPLTIGFNNKYMTDALKACGDETVKFEMSGPRSPIKIIPTDSDKFTFLVLPVRLNEQG